MLNHPAENDLDRAITKLQSDHDKAIRRAMGKILADLDKYFGPGPEDNGEEV